MKFNLKKPCKDCPFRKDSLKGWLGKERASEVANYANNDKTFPCHKTTRGKESSEQQCAGALLLSKKQGKLNNNWLFRFAQRIGLFKANELSGEELIFDNEEEMSEHHSSKFLK